MTYVKKIVAILILSVMTFNLSGNVTIMARQATTPKIKVKTFKKGTGVKITISPAGDYLLYITGIPTNSDYCDYFKYKDNNGYVNMKNQFFESFYLIGPDDNHVAGDTVGDITYCDSSNNNITITYNDFQPGKYTVKVCPYQTGHDLGTWSKEKTFTIKESKTKGYANDYDFSNVNKGDIVKFGSYEQDLDYTNGKEPIEWIVLDKTDDELFLLSKYALDCLPYNKEYTDVTWEECSLRKWLNNDFIKSAFNKTEKGMLITKRLDNFDNEFYETLAGNKTKDKVFLLSHIDMVNSDYGFKKPSSFYSHVYEQPDMERRCTFAWYKNTKCDQDIPATLEGEPACYWWLRTPGRYSYLSSCVNKYGSVDLSGLCVSNLSSGIYIRYDFDAVRPALYVKIKND
ncbi:MAG: hypothetical protein IKP88_17225 [Lachnospiraceae bacterium]|nr:hypothetical protein [Lachnospiraceae bacterium]